MTKDLESFLGGGAPGLKFPTKGTSYRMTLTGPPEMKQQVDFDTGEPLVWPDGKPRMQMVLTGTIPESQWWEDYDEDLEGEVRCFIKSGLRTALRDGLKKAKAKVSDLDDGAVLEIKYVKDGAKEGRKQPPKVYSIKVIDLPDRDAKAAADFLDEDDEEEAPPRRRRRRDEDDEPPRRRRAVAEDDDEDDEDEDDEPPRRRRSRTPVTDEVREAKRNAAKRSAAAAKSRVADDEEDDDEEPPF